MEFFSFDSGYLERMMARDPGVERHFHDYFSELLHIKLRARQYHRHAIDDICQETLLRVLQAIRRGAIRDPQRIGSFANSVCNNVMQEYARAGNRFATTEDGVPDVPDPRADSERATAERERATLVRSVLDELSPRNRALLTAVFLEEQPAAEVCLRMGVDSNYLRVLLFRARTQFREVLERKRIGKST